MVENTVKCTIAGGKKQKTELQTPIKLKDMNIKTPCTIVATAILFAGYCLLPAFSFSQCHPYIKIDGNVVLASGENTGVEGLRLPYWLKAGQTIIADQNVNSISVIEFTVNGTALDFSQVLSVASTLSTVPAGKVWKIESINKQETYSRGNSIAFSAPMTKVGSGEHSYGGGTSSWTVPPCVNYICVELWGGGGGGGGNSSGTGNGAGGGGGGAYGYGCYAVTPGTVLTITIGAGGAEGLGNANGSTGGTSSVGAPISISATGGSGGVSGNGTGAGGAGGTSTAPSNASGIAGYARNGSTNGGGGGQGANAGGNGGIGGDAGDGTDGGNPGAGGGGSCGCGDVSNHNGGAGGAGKVIITW